MVACSCVIVQGLHCDYDDIVVAACSGGTLSDLAIANYLTGSMLSLPFTKYENPLPNMAVTCKVYIPIVILVQHGWLVNILCK